MYRGPKGKHEYRGEMVKGFQEELPMKEERGPLFFA